MTESPRALPRRIAAHLLGRLALLCASGLTLLSAGCTDAQLYHLTEVPSLPDKVAFSGNVCTDNPAERSFPLRVVYLMDTSPVTPSGMAGPDVALLTQQRVQAVRDSVTVLRGGDSQFALVRFGGTTVLAPEGGFTDNSTVIAEAAGALSISLPGAGEGQRRTVQAFQVASSLITGDLLSQPKGPRSRTKYVIVLVTHGPIDDATLNNQVDPAAGCDRQCVLQARVDELRQTVLDNGGADFIMHTVDLTPISDNAAERDQAQEDLTVMSFAGAGEYRQVCRRDPNTGALVPSNCGPQSLSLLGVDINSARNVFITKSFIVANINAIHTDDGAIPDSDGDGLADREEDFNGDGVVRPSLCEDGETVCASDTDCVGVGDGACRPGETDPTKRDTDGDGIGDKVESLLRTVGLDPLAPDAPVQCATIINPETTDTDGDGLTDCEEALLRMDSTLFDTDADGLPDLLEFLAGTNFLLGDALSDLDFDGENNAAELRAHTDPRSSDPIARAELPYLYREVDLGIREHRFASQPRDVVGVTMREVSVGSGLGNGTLVYLPGDPPTIAWKDAEEDTPGQAIRPEEDGVYTLSGCPVIVEETEEEARERCEALNKNLTVEITRAILPPYPSDELIRISVAERQCTDFRVRNITLVETLEADGRSYGNNDVRIYFGQVPQDRPESFGIYRVAQYNYRFVAPIFKEPNVADQPVDSHRFVLFGD
jgi:hypothetical protein